MEFETILQLKREQPNTVKSIYSGVLTNKYKYGLSIVQNNGNNNN